MKFDIGERGITPIIAYPRVCYKDVVYTECAKDVDKVAPAEVFLYTRPIYEFPMKLLCVDTGDQMTLQSNGEWLCVCGKVYPVQSGIVVAWPTNMDTLAKEEATYHDHFDEAATEVHQLSSYRNMFYHKRIWDAIKTVPKGSAVLEIGAGSGFDASQLKNEYELTLSDVSPKTLVRLADKLQILPKSCVAADGAVLPFANSSFAAVYLIATLHHFPQPIKPLTEMHRVLQPGGVLAIGIEPNATYFRFIKKFRTLLCRATHEGVHDGSHADEEMEGFTKKELQNALPEELWENIEIKPVWFFAGFMQYGLEFLFRALKLKKRIVLPKWLDCFVVSVDELLFKIPGLDYFAWHWNIIAKRK